MTLNFKDHFANLVLSGEKQQTIRRVRKSRPIREGDALQLYRGLRTAHANKLRDEICTSVLPVKIDSDGRVFLNGDLLSADSAIALARADGFPEFQDCVEFFAYYYGLPFEGVVIKWCL